MTATAQPTIKAKDSDLSPTHDCYIRAGRSAGAKRTTFNASCRCGWSGKARATSERARQDWLDHDHPVEASQ